MPCPIYKPRDGDTCCLLKDISHVLCSPQFRAFSLVMNGIPCLSFHISLIEIKVCGLQPMERVADKVKET